MGGAKRSSDTAAAVIGGRGRTPTSSGAQLEAKKIGKGIPPFTVLV